MFFYEFSFFLIFKLLPEFNKIEDKFKFDDLLAILFHDYNGKLFWTMKLDLIFIILNALIYKDTESVKLKILELFCFLGRKIYYLFLFISIF